MSRAVGAVYGVHRLSAKETYISAKEPCISEKEPYISEKSLYTC